MLKRESKVEAPEVPEAPDAPEAVISASTRAALVEVARFIGSNPLKSDGLLTVLISVWRLGYWDGWASFAADLKENLSGREAGE